MTVAPPTPVPTPAPVTGTPSWLTHLVAILVAVAGIVTSQTVPNLSGTVQAWITVASVFAGAVIHLVKVILADGLTRAGLLKTVSVEEAWVKENWQTLVAAYEAARNLIGTGRLDLLEGRVQKVETDIARLPADQQAALASSLQRLLGQSAQTTPPVA